MLAFLPYSLYVPYGYLDNYYQPNWHQTFCLYTRQNVSCEVQSEFVCDLHKPVSII
jgi:hypothetical protein